MHALSRLPLRRIGLQFELGVNAADDQDPVFDLHFADRFGRQAIVRSWDLTRLQRASKGAGQSTCRRRNDVVQCGRVRLQRPGRYLVVLRHGAVHSENHRLVLSRQIGPANRALHALDSNFGTVHNVGHSGMVPHAGPRAKFTLVRMPPSTSSTSPGDPPAIPASRPPW